MFTKLLKFYKTANHMEFSTLHIKTKHSYEESIKALNNLISNSYVIKKSCEKGPEFRKEHVPRTKMFCERAQVQISDIDKLNIVHVAGTKGKGSTCTYIDAILHNCGYKTGLFTSPHLKEVRERIKINGSPISAEDFNDYFWPVYDKLLATQKDSMDMPFYFQFLTILAFDVFLKEKVDYVILETGIGGRFDSTNIISHPKVACITALGYDHIDILGSTMSEIAWNKAGIIKHGSVTFTCNNQPKEALEVIEKEIDVNSGKLYLVPIEGSQMINVIDKTISNHSENYILASAICQKLLNENFDFNIKGVNNSSNVFQLERIKCLNTRFDQIINSTQVIGRYHTFKRLLVNYYIDGAHTVESIKTTVEWFKKITERKRFEKRYLVFMITGSRSVENLLLQLKEINFDGILLAPMIPFKQNQPFDFAVDEGIIEREKLKLLEIAEIWTKIKQPESNNNQLLIEYFSCFADIDNWLIKSGTKIQVLVVGSLHLVGCALSVLS